MSLTSHIAELERKHQALDRKLAEELNHPARDSAKIAELKRRKLVIKDELSRLRCDQPGDTRIH